MTKDAFHSLGNAFPAVETPQREKIVIVDDHELALLAWRFRRIADQIEDGQIRKVHVWLDGGLKLKVNDNAWLPPIGKIKL